jgi:glucan 1,3-beta-glucosidase
MRPAGLLPAFAALLLAALFGGGLWAWLGRPVALPDVASGRLQCLSYAPSHDGVAPQDKAFTLPPGLLEADMARLKPLAGCVRTYSSLGSEGDVVAAAAAQGMKVLVGIWIGADEKINAQEIERGLALAAAHPEAVKALVVGNEVLLRREMTGEKLAGVIRAVKARTRHPVTYADIYEFWRRNPAVAEAVDWITVHVLPYWDDPTPVDIDAVQGHVRGIIEGARALFPAKPVEVGEIGWPSAGRTRGGATPSRVNQARFLREFALQAETLGVAYNVIEAIDQPWKREPEGTVGGFWGVLDKDRRPKFPLTGPVSEWPAWPWAAAFSVAGAALALGAALARRRPLPPANWLATAAAGGATAGLMWVFADQALDFAIGVHGALWGAYLLALAAAGGALLVRYCGGYPLPGRTILAVYRWLVLVPAATVALAIAVDGRHRDFLTLAFLLPAAALFFCDRAPRKKSPAEGWLGATVLVAGPLGIDWFTNYEAIAWAACCLMLAYPFLGQVVAELRRLGAALREEDDGGYHRHG